MKKPSIKGDAIAKMADASAINQAAVPQADAAKAPTLGRTYRPAPMKGPVQGAVPVAPQAPQRMAFGGPTPAAPKPAIPKGDVLSGLASGLRETPAGVNNGAANNFNAGAIGDGSTGGVAANPVGGLDDRLSAGPDYGTPEYGAGDFGSGDLVGAVNAPPMSEADRDQRERDALDKQIRDFVSGRVSGANDVDTTEQEALIRDLVEGKTGAALVDQRARGGRAGFATSGAQMAMEGDIRKQAGQAASGDILDLRRTEQQRAFDNATKAIETESGMRSAASDDALRRMFLESLQAEAGLEAPGGTAADAIVGGGDALVGAVGGQTTKPSTATSGSKPTVSAPPAGFTLYQTLSNGDQLWKSPNDPGDNSTVVVVKGNA